MPNELMVSALAGNLQMLKTTLADFSDADMLVRPCPGANHAAWQLGHVCCSETRLVNLARPGAMPELPAGFAERFTKETAASDDPARFPTKAQLLATLEKVRQASIAWVTTLTEQDLKQPAPEQYRHRIPTVGHLALLLSGHLTMHMGQLQVIRRKLGKPILF